MRIAGITVFVAGLIVGLTPTISWPKQAPRRELPKDPREWPVRTADGVVILDRSPSDRDDHRSFSGPHDPALAVSGCSLLTSFVLPSEFMAPRVDSARRVHELHVGSIRFTVDSALNRDIDTFPMGSGVVWVAEDLDRDGSLEIVVQRGDGVNGFLDIVSTATWATRQRFTFAGMNVVMFAQTFQLDADPYPELYLVPGGLSGQSTLVIIKYDVAADSFFILAQTDAPYQSSYRRGAVADFDNDGRVEFVQTDDAGVGIYEYNAGQIIYKGRAWPTSGPARALACRPKPGGVVHLLLAEQTPDYVWHYRLLEPVGDEVFALVYTVEDTVGVIGKPDLGALDSDCDGLDELLIYFLSSTFVPADYEVWGWDQATADFERKCVWVEQPAGVYVWYGLDFNWDGSKDWISAHHAGGLRAFSGGPCECVCFCHADPQCDGQTDVLDVTQTVGVAFRGQLPTIDPNCPRERTDVNCTGFTDVLDVTSVVDVAFRAADPSTKYCAPCL